MAISPAGKRRIAVDGATYYWSTRDIGTWGDSRSEATIIAVDDVVPGQRRLRIRFTIAPTKLTERRWWNQTRVFVVVTPRAIQRAIRIARRHPSAAEIVLTEAEVDEALDIEVATVEQELRAARALIAGLPANRDELVRCLLAIGCEDGSRDLVDDWVASMADELVAARGSLQAVLDSSATLYGDYAFRTRSGIELLVEMCERLDVELGLDASIVDDRLREMRRGEVVPCGIPATHWWWGPPSES